MEIQPWWFTIAPYEGESISHFLGRFRRENELTPSALGKVTGLSNAYCLQQRLRSRPLGKIPF